MLLQFHRDHRGRIRQDGPKARIAGLYTGELAGHALAGDNDGVIDARQVRTIGPAMHDGAVISQDHTSDFYPGRVS